MATYELKIDTSIDSERILEDVSQAINRLSNASEEQFQVIKTEKWFNRLWNMVTLSSKKDIRMAEQISTLAQAQEGLVNILVVLSAQNQAISDLVRENMELFKKFQNNDNYLLQRIKDLEDIVYGFTKGQDISKLSEIDKATLLSCIYYLSLRFDTPSPNQQDYADAVIVLLNNDEKRIDGKGLTEKFLREQLPKIKTTSAKNCILMCCFEYIYLNQSKEDSFESDICKDLVRMFDVGENLVSDTKRKVIEAERLRGAAGLINKYCVSEEVMISDIFTMDLDIDESELEETAEPESEYETVPPQNFSKIKECINAQVELGGLGESQTTPKKLPQKLLPQADTEKLLRQLLPQNTPLLKTVVQITKVKKDFLVFTTYALYYIPAKENEVIQLPYSQMSPQNVGISFPQGEKVFYCGEKEIYNANIADALVAFSKKIYEQEPKPQSDLVTPFERLDEGIRIGYFRIIASILKEEGRSLFDLFRLVDTHGFVKFWPNITNGPGANIEAELSSWKRKIPYPNKDALCQKLVKDLCSTQLWTKFWTRDGNGISLSLSDEQYYDDILLTDEEPDISVPKANQQPGKSNQDAKKIIEDVIKDQAEWFSAISGQDSLTLQERNEKINSVICGYEHVIAATKQSGYADIQQELENILAQLKGKVAENVEKMIDESLESTNQTAEDELESMQKKARKVVYGFAASTTATGAVPIPFADMPLLIGQQVAMLTSIASIFEISIGQDALKSLVLGAIGISGAAMMGKTVVSSTLKLVPGIGSLAGGAISAGTAGTLTLALGNGAIVFFTAIKRGELSPDDISQKAGKDMFKAAFQAQLKLAKETDAVTEEDTNK